MMLKELLWAIFLIHSIESLNECCFNSTFAYRDNQDVLLYNFNRFDQLKFNCTEKTQISLLLIHPNKKLILDKSFDLTGNKIQLKEKSIYFGIRFSNLRGIDLDTSNFHDNNFLTAQEYHNVLLSFEGINFDFYLNETIVSEKLCTRDSLPGKLFMSLLNTMNGAIDLSTETKFASKICPFVFKNFFVHSINIKELSSSFIDMNLLSFQNISAYDLNSRIIWLKLGMYNCDLNENILNRFVFENTIFLNLNGPINSIQGDLFKSLKLLRHLNLRSQNIKRIFVHNNKWLNYLNLGPDNTKLNEYFVLTVFQALPNSAFYEYPNEDFCYFKTFPHQRSVLPTLKPMTKSKCTCLELFLIQYAIKDPFSIQRYINGLEVSYNYLQYYLDEIFFDDQKKCLNESFESNLIKCDFKNRFINCEIQQKPPENDFFFYIYSWPKVVYVIEKYFPKYVTLAFCLVGMGFNSVMIVILSNRKKIMTDKMYTYLLINSYFSFFYSFILTIKCVIKYMDDRNAVAFYDNYYLTPEIIRIQYFNLYLIKFGSNIFRTGSNISYFSFVFSRYISITKNNIQTRLNKFNKKLNTKLFILLTLTISILINVYIIFQFQIDSSTKLDPMELQNMKNFSSIKMDSIDDYKENFSSSSEFILMNVAFFAKMIFSDLAHIIASTIVDIFLFSFVKRKMKMKRNLIAVNVVANIELMSNIQKAKKNTTKSSQRRISNMIVLNGINFLFLRLPLAVLNFYGFVFRFNKESKSFSPNLYDYIVCKKLRLCASLYEIFICLYLSSFLFEFIIFCKLDTNFKLSIDDIKKKYFSFKSKS